MAWHGLGIRTMNGRTDGNGRGFGEAEGRRGEERRVLLHYTDELDATWKLEDGQRKP